MKRLVLILTLLISLPVMSQTIEVVEVPKGHKVVFIPWWVPASELTWTWRPAIEAAAEEEDDELVLLCDGLVLSPNVRDPRCDDAP